MDIFDFNIFSKEEKEKILSIIKVVYDKTFMPYFTIDFMIEKNKIFICEINSV
jgi:hypothetical protein